MDKRIRLKICGITRQQDADVCSRLGVDFCGFVFHPASPRFMTPEQVATIHTSCPRVGVFTTHDVDVILKTMQIAGLDFAQLHADQSEDVARAIGGDRIFRVRLPASPDAQWSTPVAYHLFDAGPGTGTPFDWSSLSGDVPRPFFVAGGLHAGNIPALLAICHPDGLDLNSGVEIAPGIKSETLIRTIKEQL